MRNASEKWSYWRLLVFLVWTSDQMSLLHSLMLKKIARINLLNKSQTLTVAKCWIGKEEFEPSTENSSNSSNLDQMKHKQNADKYTCDWKQKDYDCSAIKMLTCQYSVSVNRHDIVSTTNGLQKCSWADWLTVEKKNTMWFPYNSVP